MNYNKILIIRTDRLGDVILSTPAIHCLRQAYPAAHIAMMVRPYTQDIVQGNPELNEVILHDKDMAHRSVFATALFALSLRKKKFDLALILHSTNRACWLAFLAGIHSRVGYDKKAAYLLTKKIPYVKREGKKHESEYTLDILREIGIPVNECRPHVPVREEALGCIQKVLEKEGISEGDFLVVMHPGASCPSKRWPYERFARLADRLTEECGAKIVIAGSEAEEVPLEAVKNMMKRSPAVFFGISVAELAALISKCSVFISNDTGPAHMAGALNKPVFVMFGRAQAGLSPARWRPLGESVTVFHRDAGCAECLAHNCRKDFACLKAITVDEVFDAARSCLR